MIAAWYGSSRRGDQSRRDSLYVPQNPDTPSHLQQLIGQPAYERLVKAFGGTQIRHIPQNTQYLRHLCRRQVFDMLKGGVSVPEVCQATGLSTVHVNTIRRELEGIGVLPLILKEPTDD